MAIEVIVLLHAFITRPGELGCCSRPDPKGRDIVAQIASTQQKPQSSSVLSRAQGNAILGAGVTSARTREEVLGVPIDVLGWAGTIDLIFEWCRRGESRTVCICNVHSIVTARQNTVHADIIRFSDLATPDGAPIAWIIRKRGHINQERISGPDLMWNCCRRAANTGVKTF